MIFMKKILAFLILTLLLLAAAGCTEAPAEPTVKPTATTAPTEPALDFTVTDTEGNVVKLSDFASKPVVVNFWATWCNPCTSELPDFEAAAKANPGIQFMMINATDGRDETPEKVTEFIEKNGYTFDVFYDHEMATIRQLNIQGFPTSYFIDAQGNVVDSHLGMMDAATLESYIALIR